MARRRPVDQASTIVAQYRHRLLDQQADEAFASEGWKRTTPTDSPDYVAGLAQPESSVTCQPMVARCEHLEEPHADEH